jgi:3-hydroxyisobutyrate dehydrogenase-like beta-hydroxyacid dehydrogenase
MSLSSGMRVGLIGVGAMGAPIARALLAAGYDLMVFDRCEAARQALADEGAVLGRNSAVVARESDILLLSLPNDAAVEEVATQAVAVRAAPGLVVCDLSTIAAPTARQLAKTLAVRGVEWLDCPVTGGVVGAEGRSLTALVGGEADALERCRPVLMAFCSSVEHLGPSGAGCTAKAVNGIAVGVQMVSIFEAFTVAAAAGIDPKRLWDILRTSTSDCWILEHLVPPTVLAAKFDEPRFSAAMQLKDLKIARRTAEDAGVTTPGLAAAERLFERAVSSGLGAEDQMAAIKVYATEAGVTNW